MCYACAWKIYLRGVIVDDYCRLFQWLSTIDAGTLLDFSYVCTPLLLGTANMRLKIIQCMCFLRQSLYHFLNALDSQRSSSLRLFVLISWIFVSLSAGGGLIGKTAGHSCVYFFCCAAVGCLGLGYHSSISTALSSPFNSFGPQMPLRNSTGFLFFLAGCRLVGAAAGASGAPSSSDKPSSAEASASGSACSPDNTQYC